MSLWTMPALVSAVISNLVACLDRRTGKRFWSIFFGLLICREKRRTASAWFRAAGIGADFRRAYNVLGSVGRRARSLGAILLTTIEQIAGGKDGRYVFALDDTVTKRYGPCVEGAGVHRNPTPGPAAQDWVYGHVWVTLARVIRHSLWGAIALPVRAALYVRQKDLGTIPPDYKWKFRTKLELAVELIDWLVIWLGHKGQSIWLLMDGAYAKRVVLQAAKAAKVIVVSRLRHDAALWTLPDTERPKGKRGRTPKYGKHKISLAKRAAAKGGWITEEVEIYGRFEDATYKTFLATWPPAGGVIRVVLVKNKDGWVAYFCTDPNATAADILGLVSDRGAIEQVFHDVKEIWGAGQQQLRHVYANVGAWHLNLWAYTLVELWAWHRPEEELVDRSASPWDAEWRRPSHADRRKAMLREILRAEIQAASSGPGQRGKLKTLAERLLLLAA
jgi:DDE superfamily endonuclease